MKKLLLATFALTVPATTFAAQGLQGYIPSVINFIYTVLVPFVLGVAFLIVVVNIVRYFVVESTNEEGREKAKAYILYSIMAFVLIIVFFGIVGLLVRASGLNSATPAQPDYFEAFGGGSGSLAPPVDGSLEGWAPDIGGDTGPGV